MIANNQTVWARIEAEGVTLEPGQVQIGRVCRDRNRRLADALKGALPPAAAVYFVVEGNEVVYIGASKNLYQRWLMHHTAALLESYAVLRWSLTPDNQMRDCESRLIQAFQPPLNKSGKAVKQKPQRFGQAVKQVKAVGTYSSEGCIRHDPEEEPLEIPLSFARLFRESETSLSSKNSGLAVLLAYAEKLVFKECLKREIKFSSVYELPEWFHLGRLTSEQWAEGIFNFYSVNRVPAKLKELCDRGYLRISNQGKGQSIEYWLNLHKIQADINALNPIANKR